MIATVADFKGDYYIPQRDAAIPVQNYTGAANTPVADAINALIEQHEPEILRRSLGADLYDALVVGLAEPSPEQRWLDLRDGVSYTDTYNRKHYFGGVKKISICETYYWYQRNNATQTTNVGEVSNKTENSVRETPAQKMVTADNKRAELTRQLLHFLKAKKADYPEWIPWSCDMTLLKKNNTFGLL